MQKVSIKAPARLDVMGGVADNFGSWVLQMALNYHATATVIERNDNKISISTRNANEAMENNLCFSIGELLEADYAAAKSIFQGPRRWAAYALGAIPVLKKEEGIELKKGADVTIDSEIPMGAAISSSAALELASMLALMDFNGQDQDLYDLDSLRIAELCQTVENRIAGAPCGRMDQIIGLLGEKDHLLPILCRGIHPIEPGIRLPEGVAVAGIYTNVQHSIAAKPYANMRIGARMAQRILQRAGLLNEQSYLCNMNPEEYLGAKIPEAMWGGDFSLQYGELSDPVVVLDKETLYHPFATGYLTVSENARVRKFIKLLKEPSANGLVEAGQLMYQRNDCYREAGLGSWGVDVLVNQLQSLGVDAGIYGATITGGGSGGTVAVLYKKGCKNALETAMQAYKEKTNNEPVLFNKGSSDGALKLRSACEAKIEKFT